MAPIPGLHELFDQVARGEPVVNYPLEGALVTDPTEYRYWNVSYFPVYGPNGIIQGITAASQEITQQKKAEKALIESEKLAAVGRLAASIAHEINNPLEAVTNLLYLARLSTNLEEVPNLLQAADTELRRVSAIAAQTLRFHRQSSSPQAIESAAGRAINDSDTAHRQKVAVINQAIAKRFFPKGDAVGRSLSIDIDDVKGPWQIVGIARDTKAGDPRSSAPLRMTYIPLAQIDPFNPVDPTTPATNPPTPPEENQDRVADLILLRTTGDPANTIADLRVAVASIDPNLPLIKITTIRDQVDDFMAHDQLVSTLTTLFAGLALLLAAIGLYGVMSYNVVRRTNEIGIRIALGAQTPAVQWMILSESLLLLAIGVCLGLPLTLLTTKYIKGQLFGLSALDPVTFTVALAVVSAMTMFAAWLPARRASKVDPMVALRCD